MQITPAQTTPPLRPEDRAPAPQPSHPRLWQAAQELEASFLAEMLGAAGLGTPREAFGGGAGEEHFGSFLRQEQARAMVQAGGIGLAQTIYTALVERADG